jgi:hypothetical protein
MNVVAKKQLKTSGFSISNGWRATTRHGMTSSNCSLVQGFGSIVAIWNLCSTVLRRNANANAKLQTSSSNDANAKTSPTQVTTEEAMFTKHKKKKKQKTKNKNKCKSSRLHTTNLSWHHDDGRKGADTMSCDATAREGDRHARRRDRTGMQR